MPAQEWPADDYAIGSYIQATVAERYLPYLHINSNDQVLDIGCGDGAFSKKILDKIPEGALLGIDASDNMLHLAKGVARDYPNFSIKKADVFTMDFNEQFDYVVSFWCLQWAADIYKAFENIIKALKTGGKMLAIFPAGDDPYIKGYYALKHSGQFSSLANFIPPMDYSRLDNLSETLKTISCKNLKVELCHHCLTLPSLDVFRKFVNGIAFYQGQVPEEEIKFINESLVHYFDEECQKKYRGEHRFDFSIYWVTGEK